MGIGRTLRILRNANGLSQKGLATSLSVTPGYLSLIERNEREPSLEFLHRLSDFFDIPAGLLLLHDASHEHPNAEVRNLLRESRHVMMDYILSRPSGNHKKQKKRRARARRSS
jgi:transcriptional regulator with XRE-family HTH domain